MLYKDQRVKIDGSFATIKWVNKASARVVFDNSSTKTVSLKNITIMKKTKKRFKQIFEQTVPQTIRHGRYRKIDVVPTRFNPNHILGNYEKMARIHDYRKHGVMMFNDNLHDWVYFGLNPHDEMYPGGGNACIRPLQHLGDSIGMPTGPFASLAEKHNVEFACNHFIDLTAQEIIDVAINRIIQLFINSPDKHTLYYSVNPNDPIESRKLGLAIFAGAVGDDVITYISDRIQEIPRLIQEARVLGKSPEPFARFEQIRKQLETNVTVCDN